MRYNESAAAYLIRLLVCIFLGISIPTSCILGDFMDNLENMTPDDDGDEVPDEGENPDGGGNPDGGDDGDGGDGDKNEPLKAPTTLAEMMASIPQGYMEYRSFDENGYDHNPGNMFDNGTGWTPDGSFVSLGGNYSNSVLQFTMGGSYHELFKFDNIGLGFFKTENDTVPQEDMIKGNEYSSLRSSFFIMTQLWEVLNKYRNHYGLVGPVELKVVGTEEMLGRKVTHYKGEKPNGGSQEYWVLDNGDCLKYKYTSVYSWVDPPKEEIDGMEITYWDENLTNGYELFGAALNHNPSGGKAAYYQIPVEKLTKHTSTWDKSLYPSETDNEWKNISYKGLGVDDLIPPYTGSGEVVAMNIESDHGHSFFGSVHTIEVLVKGGTKEDAKEYINTIAKVKYAESTKSFEYGTTVQYAFESSACDADQCPSGHDPDFLPGPSHEIGYEVAWNECSIYFSSGVAKEDEPVPSMMTDHGNNSTVSVPAGASTTKIKIWLIRLSCWY